MHEDRDGHVHVSSEEASGASKEGVVRWVLVIGLLLAIGLLTVTWITGALTQNEYEEEGDVGGQIAASQDNGDEATDSVVSDDFAPEAGSAPVDATVDASPGDTTPASSDEMQEPPPPPAN